MNDTMNDTRPNVTILDAGELGLPYTHLRYLPSEEGVLRADAFRLTETGEYVKVCTVILSE